MKFGIDSSSDIPEKRDINRTGSGSQIFLRL